MVKFEKIKKGMRLFDVVRNKGMSANKWLIWPVDIISVDPKTRSVVASWNGNKATTMFENRVTKYRLKSPKNEDRW